MENLNQAFDQFISLRMEYIASSILSESNDYKQLIHECNQSFLDLQANLLLKDKVILQHYDANTTLLQGIAETLMYTQGLKDGIRLNKLLGNE